MKQCSIGILGGGIMGCCLALEIARRYRKVDLIDLAPEPMMGASLHNEGKIHLGFVYANDPSNETFGLMTRGSMAFARIVCELTNQDLDILKLSQPFHYWVPHDSQVGLDAIENHFNKVEAAAMELSRTTGDSYLGRSIDHYFQRNSVRVHEKYFSPTPP
ncbi:MAG: FAD-binding oxidoreductase, partial [Candidatus Electrothrix sp. AS4_5]|nr:FAD-binding oxidoreductase [Candidatus Electrothrix gigas]